MYGVRQGIFGHHHLDCRRPLAAHCSNFTFGSVVIMLPLEPISNCKQRLPRYVLQSLFANRHVDPLPGHRPVGGVLARTALQSVTSTSLVPPLMPNNRFVHTKKISTPILTTSANTRNTVIRLVSS